MALVKGTNSYVTADEADTYFEDRIDAASWDSATADAKDRALVTAWRVLDQLAWLGQTVTAGQPMAWPRIINGFVDLRQGRTYQVRQESTDDAVTEVKIAQYELAYHYISNPTVISQGATVTNLTLGTLALDAIQNPSILPAYVRRFIQPFLLTGNTNSWFLAN